jgi:hypothetical protein
MNNFLKALDDFTKKPVNDLSSKKKKENPNKTLKKIWRKLM